MRAPLHNKRFSIRGRAWLQGAGNSDILWRGHLGSSGEHYTQRARAAAWIGEVAARREGRPLHEPKWHRFSHADSKLVL